MNTMFSRLDYIDAARRVGDQFVELTSMLPDHDLPLTDNPSLGVHQCVNQVARTPSWLLALATDAASWSGDPAEMPTHDPRAIDSTRTRSIPACVHQLRTDLDVLLDTVKHMSAQVACAVLPDGSKVRCDAALGILIGELLIWGHDIARTVRAPCLSATRSPARRCVIFSPTALTTPAASPPGAKGKGGLNWYLPSMIRVSGKLTPAACTSISTSFFFGSGLGRSSRTRLEAGPKALHRTAFMTRISSRSSGLAV